MKSKANDLDAIRRQLRMILSDTTTDATTDIGNTVDATALYGMAPSVRAMPVLLARARQAPGSIDDKIEMLMEYINPKPKTPRRGGLSIVKG
jgi:hypothetical protein